LGSGIVDLNLGTKLSATAQRLPQSHGGTEKHGFFLKHDFEVPVLKVSLLKSREREYLY
jgi:hypothetical protein